MPKNNIKKLSQQQNKNKINCSRRCLEVFWNGTIVLQWRQSVIHIFTSECLCIKTTANVNFFHKWWRITLPSFFLVFPSRPCSDQAHFGILTACCPRWQKEYHQIQDLYPLLAGYLSKRSMSCFRLIIILEIKIKIVLLCFGVDVYGKISLALKIWYSRKDLCEGV